jgi:hypothetical protein
VLFLELFPFFFMIAAGVIAVLLFAMHRRSDDPD